MAPACESDIEATSNDLETASGYVTSWNAVGQQLGTYDDGSHGLSPEMVKAFTTAQSSALDIRCLVSRDRDEIVIRWLPERSGRERRERRTP